MVVPFNIGGSEVGEMLSQCTIAEVGSISARTSQSWGPGCALSILLFRAKGDTVLVCRHDNAKQPTESFDSLCVIFHA